MRLGHDHLRRRDQSRLAGLRQEVDRTPAQIVDFIGGEGDPGTLRFAMTPQRVPDVVAGDAACAVLHPDLAFEPPIAVFLEVAQTAPDRGNGVRSNGVRDRCRLRFRFDVDRLRTACADRGRQHPSEDECFHRTSSLPSAGIRRCKTTFTYPLGWRRDYSADSPAQATSVIR